MQYACVQDILLYILIGDLIQLGFRMLPTVYCSNKIEALTFLLSERVLSNTSLETKQWIVLPSIGMKSELFPALLEGREGDVLLGVECLDLSSLFFALTKNAAFCTSSLLALHLKKIIDASNEEELAVYLEGRNRESKLEGLCRELGREFFLYGTYGSGEWKGWKKSLWNELICNWTFPLAHDREVWSGKKIDIHFFGLSNIPNVMRVFLEKCESLYSQQYYVLSPSAFYWADSVSDREKVFLRKVYGGNDFEKFVQCQNRLVANYSRHGRDLFRNFVDREFEMHDLYQNISRQSFLGQLQDDLLHLREKGEEAKTHMDASLALVAAPTKLREVEICYSYVLKALSDDKSLRPSDVLVLSPNLSEIVPFIRFVFDSENVHIPYRLSDIDLSILDPFVRAFIYFLSLVGSRWESEKMLRLFAFPSFQRKFSFSDEDLFDFEKWAGQAGITWGYDLAHREDLLGIELPAMEKVGTWMYGFERLILGLAVSSDCPGFAPAILLEMSDAEKLGKCKEILVGLKDDLECLEREELSLSDWGRKVLYLIDKYFLLDSDEGEGRGKEAVITLISNLKELGEKTGDHPYPFSYIAHYLKEGLSAKKGSFYGSNRESIHFAPLEKGRIWPAKIVYLMGMDDGAFPREESPRPLSDREANWGPPRKAEEDRYAFLECLLAARTKLIMSYVSIDEKDGKERAPSFLIQEFSEILEENYKQGLEAIFHPSFSFHSSYAEAGELSPRDYLLARMYYSEEKTTAQEMPLVLSKGKTPDEDQIIEISELSLFAKNPLQHFCNKALGIRFATEEKISDKEFILTPLEKAILARAALHAPLPRLVERSTLEGLVPRGVMQGVASLRLEKYLNELSLHLTTWGLQSEKPLTCVLDPRCKKVEIDQEKNIVMLPALTLPGVKLIGKIEQVFSKGMITFGKRKLDTCLRMWPLFLIFSSLPLEGDKTLLFNADGKSLPPIEGAKEYLKRYIDYFFQARACPSPLIPLWGEAILSHDPKRIDKIYTQSIDPHMHFLFSKSRGSMGEAIIENWAEVYAHTFSPMLKWWEEGQ